MNLPNFLTLLRIGLVPIFIFFYSRESVEGSAIAALVFFIAALTDALDGYLARRRSEITRLGILLDPIADKILIISAFVLLVDRDRIPAWIAIVMIVREIAVTGLRAVAVSKGIVIAAETGGKYKTLLQVAAILCLLLATPSLPLGAFLDWAGWILLIAAMTLALSSAWRYFTKFGHQIHLLKG